MVEGHIRTNRLRVHLKLVHPLMKLGNKFRWRGTCAWIVLKEAINISRNIQVSRPLQELRGRHVVVLQMKVPQVALFRQLDNNFAEGFAYCLSPKIEESSDCSRASLDTSCSSVTVGSLAVLAVLFFGAMVQLEEVLDELMGATCTSSVAVARLEETSAQLGR